MTAQRNTGPTDGSKLAEQIEKYSASKSFLKYYDEVSFDKLPGYNKEHMEQYIPLWQAIGCPNTVKKTVMKTCMEQVAAKHAP